jgi:hypothetical protein
MGLISRGSLIALLIVAALSFGCDKKKDWATEEVKKTTIKAGLESQIKESTVVREYKWRKLIPGGLVAKDGRKTLLFSGVVGNCAHFTVSHYEVITHHGPNNTSTTEIIRFRTTLFYELESGSTTIKMPVVDRIMEFKKTVELNEIMIRPAGKPGGAK